MEFERERYEKDLELKNFELRIMELRIKELEMQQAVARAGGSRKSLTHADPSDPDDGGNGKSLYSSSVQSQSNKDNDKPTTIISGEKSSLSVAALFHKEYQEVLDKLESRGIRGHGPTWRHLKDQLTGIAASTYKRV